MLENLYAIVDRATKRVQGFTRYENYVQEHPESMLIQIPEDHEVFLSDTPQDYVYDESTQNFIRQE